MTGRTTNPQCDGCSAVSFLSDLELDSLSFFGTWNESIIRSSIHILLVNSGWFSVKTDKLFKAPKSRNDEKRKYAFLAFQRVCDLVR